MAVNFLNLEAFTDAINKHFDQQGERSILSLIKKARTKPSQEDPVQRARRANVAKDDMDEDDDDDTDTDQDTDECAMDTEQADTATRQKLRAEADRKKKLRDPSKFAAAKKAIQKIHARGARAEDPDYVVKAARVPMERIDNRRSVQLIKAAQAQPLSMQQLFRSGNNNVPIDESDIQRIIAQGQRTMRKRAGGIPGDEWRRMNWDERRAALGMQPIRKADSDIRFSNRPAFPSQSANNGNPETESNTLHGGTNNWDDEGTQRPAFSAILGGFTDTPISMTDPAVRAAIAEAAKGQALKLDRLRGRKSL
jgi:hypothetical protein